MRFGQQDSSWSPTNRYKREYGLVDSRAGTYQSYLFLISVYGYPLSLTREARVHETSASYAYSTGM